MNVIEFKTVSPLFEMERDGIKPFTERLIDSEDVRFKLLSRWVQFPAITRVIKITNPATGESFVRRFSGAMTLPIHQQWLVIYLGELKSR